MLLDAIVLGDFGLLILDWRASDRHRQLPGNLGDDFLKIANSLEYDEREFSVRARISRCKI